MQLPAATRRYTSLMERLDPRDLALTTVTLIPVLLIGYALAMSLLVPEVDVLVMVGAMLITAVGAFVRSDLARGAQPIFKNRGHNRGGSTS